MGVDAPAPAITGRDSMFTILKASQSASGPRLGRLALAGRKVIKTPHYLGVSSRGVIPHITQDNLSKHTNISGVYAALEDCEYQPQLNSAKADRQAYSSQVIERDDPPIYHFKPPGNASPLRRFVALHEGTLLVLGARRTPPVIAPAANPNTNTYVAVCTSVGFKSLNIADFITGAESLKPDIVVNIGDIPYGRALGAKRIEKATDRMIRCISDHVAYRHAVRDGQIVGKLFAPLLPVPVEKQQFYVDCLAEEVSESVDGLALYSLDCIHGLPVQLQSKPRLGFTSPATPHSLLEHVKSGVDILTVPFVGEATDAGIALTFKLRTDEGLDNQSSIAPLGYDLWSQTNATNTSPLEEGCPCYACKRHHRAFVHHLLNAKEMLAWVLLQTHNHHVIDVFFNDIRQSIANSTFDRDRAAFERSFESVLPNPTGKGPRVRGYHLKSEGPGEARKNKPSYNTINHVNESIAEADPLTPQIDADDLENARFCED